MFSFRKSTNSPKYSPARNSDTEAEADIIEKRELLRHRIDSPSSPWQQAQAASKPLWKRFIWPAVLTTLNLMLLGISLASLHYVHDIRNNPDRELMKMTSRYSPLFDKINVGSYRDVTFNGSLFAPRDREPSIFRLPPSAEVDAAWDYISDTGPFVVSGEDIRRIGKDTTTAVKVPLSWGHGDDAYIAQSDGLHQIHCLNTLRKAAYTNREYYKNETHHNHGGGFKPKHPHWQKALEEAHIAHCTYTLLQSLQCNVNYDLVTYNWRKGQNEPFPDFEVTHKCRNFDTLVNWYYKNKLVFGDDDDENWIRRPTDQPFIELSAPDEGVPQN